MTVTVRGGPYTKQLSRDKEGHRSYQVSHLVQTTSGLDGPQVVMNTPGLPAIGSIWNFDNDLDAWAFCLPTMMVKIHKERKGDPPNWWKVEQTFSTRPQQRCQDESIEDPLLEPDRISGGFVKYTEEAIEDRNGERIQSSSFETLRGPQVEFDANRPTVRIGQNVASLELDVFAEMVDTVNDDTLWGLAARKVKLSNVTWQKNLYGLCNFYYTRDFEFDINFKTFDKEADDSGFKALNGKYVGDEWVLIDITPGNAPVNTNPQHFSQYKDRNDENTRVILNGFGEPWDGTGTDGPGKITVEKYDESNFLLLGIPTVL